MAKSTMVAAVFYQTIALIRYQLLGIVNRRLLLMLLGLTVLVFVAGQFTQVMALINSTKIALATQAEILRYALAVFMMVIVCHQVTSDYELQFFSRLLSMPVPRYRYIVATYFLVLILSLFMALPVLLLLGFTDFKLALYWYAAISLELFLVGQIASLMAVSLEKLTVALLATAAFYIFCKTLPLMLLALERGADIYHDDMMFGFLKLFMDMMRYVMPEHGAFARSDLLFVGSGQVSALLSQTFAVLVYGLFLQAVTLVDYYRKEFSLS